MSSTSLPAPVLSAALAAHPALCWLAPPFSATAGNLQRLGVLLLLGSSAPTVSGAQPRLGGGCCPRSKRQHPQVQQRAAHSGARLLLAGCHLLCHAVGLGLQEKPYAHISTFLTALYLMIL